MNERKTDALRCVSIVPNYTEMAAGSAGHSEPLYAADEYSSDRSPVSRIWTVSGSPAPSLAR